MVKYFGNMENNDEHKKKMVFKKGGGQHRYE